MIKESVYLECPFLVNPTDDAKVDYAVNSAFIELQIPLKKEALTETELLDEANYSLQEKRLVTLYASYSLHEANYSSQTIGLTSGAVKKEKADVLEVEYQTSQISSSDALLNYAKKVCSQAQSMKVVLEFCRNKGLLAKQVVRIPDWVKY